MEKNSTFVTVLAWIFIILASLSSFTSILQSVMVNLMFSGEEINNVPEDTDAIARFMFQNFELLVYGYMLLSFTTLISSIGLLKRLDWARLIFISILGFGILWQVASLIWLGYLFFLAGDGMQQVPDENFELMRNIFLIFAVIISLGIAILFGWIISKLTTTPIKEEFTLNNKLQPTAKNAAG